MGAVKIKKADKERKRVLLPFVPPENLHELTDYAVLPLRHSCTRCDPPTDCSGR